MSIATKIVATLPRLKKKTNSQEKMRGVGEKGKNRKEREKLKRHTCNRKKKKFECQVHAAKRSCATRAAILSDWRSAGTGELAGGDSGLDDDGCVPKDVVSNG